MGIRNVYNTFFITLHCVLWLWGEIFVEIYEKDIKPLLFHFFKGTGIGIFWERYTKTKVKEERFFYFFGKSLSLTNFEIYASIRHVLEISSDFLYNTSNNYQACGLCLHVFFSSKLSKNCFETRPCKLKIITILRCLLDLIFCVLFLFLYLSKALFMLLNLDEKK